MVAEYLNIGSGSAKRKKCLNVDINWDVVENIDMAADLEQLPFKNNAFKGVIASHVLEHICEYGHEGCIRECWRVLKPDGKLYIEVPDFDACIKNFSENYLGQREKWHQFIFGRHAYKGDEHKSGITGEYLTDLLLEFGFGDLKWHRGTRRVPTLTVYATKREMPDWKI